MSRKGENIYKRKDGRWEGRYKKGRKENGQLIYGYIYGKSYGSVKQELYQYKLKYMNITQLKGESGLSYEEWCFIWLTEQKGFIKTATFSTYNYKLKRYVLPLIGQIPLNELTNKKIQKIIDIWQSNGLASSTIRVLYQIVKQTLNEAYEQNKILDKLCHRIRLPMKQKTYTKSLSKQDQQKIEAAAGKLPLYKSLSVFLALKAGLRIGEVAALRWSDIDFDKRLIHIKQTFQRLPLSNRNCKTLLSFDRSKTESSNRIIPISISLYKHLKKWKQKSSGSYVCSNKFKPSEPRLLTYYFHQIRKECGISNVNFHHLRHTFATRCIESHGDIASVSKLLGHTSTKTTLDIYVDSLLETRKLVIKQMEAMSILL